jgi:hypothetical protein
VADGEVKTSESLQHKKAELRCSGEELESRTRKRLLTAERVKILLV